jgi:hypothetical protein
MGKKKTACRTLVRKPEGKKPLGGARRRWVDKMKMDLVRIGWDNVGWIDLAQNGDN